jgi:hypothetical protein
MATYKGIQGFTIQNLSADPSNPIEGQVWYNSTSKDLESIQELPQLVLGQVVEIKQIKVKVQQEQEH